METLLNPEMVAKILKGERFSGSHGAGRHSPLGAGMLYYSIVHMTKAKLCVCLGSGSGFVPKLMRQAQRDLAIKGSETFLIDANIQDPRMGLPDYHEKPTHFIQNYPDVLVLKARTEGACDLFEDGSIDFLHIDADHSFEGVSKDFNLYFQKVKSGGVITLHDTVSPECGVKDFLPVLRNAHYEFINFKIGNGTAVLVKR